MFNMGGSELVLVALVALFLIPPEKLPQVATSLGRFIAQITHHFHDIKSNVLTSLKEADPSKEVRTQVVNFKKEISSLDPDDSQS